MAKKQPNPAPSSAPDPVTVEPAAPAWEPPEGHIVSDERTYYVRVGGVRYVHVSDAPDGRWVYRAD